MIKKSTPGIMLRPEHAMTWHILLFVVCCQWASRVTAQCTMEDRVGFTGTDIGSSPTSGPTNLEECKDSCLSDDDCTAAEFRSIFCLHWTIDPKETASAGSTISIKICSPVSCSVTQTTDVDASNNDFEVTMNSFSTCQDACKLLTQCQQAVYISSTNTCHLYNTTSSTSSQSGHMSALKTTCSSGGENCCFEETSDQTRSDSPTLTVTSSLSACEELCLLVDTCNSSVFTGSSCKIFTETPVTTSFSGRTLSEKSCPEDASPGEFTYTAVCNNGSIIESVSTLAVLVLSAVVVSFCSQSS